VWRRRDSWHRGGRRLTPLGKRLADTIKMIGYRAGTALVGLLRPHLDKEEEARVLVRELFVSSADPEPHEQDHTLTIRIHRAPPDGRRSQPEDGRLHPGPGSCGYSRSEMRSCAGSVGSSQ
jgi:hypothetical protein